MKLAVALAAGLALSALFSSPLLADEGEDRRDASPQIRETAHRSIDFVPTGWKLYDKVEGDLNGDGRDDAALVIQLNDPSGVISNRDGLGVDLYDKNPRMLLVALSDEHGQLRLAGRNLRIIPDWDSPTISDPYGSMAIRDGKLWLYLEFFANAGGWTMFNQTFQFRWNGKSMALIGYDYNEVQRNSGETNSISVNYLTHRRSDKTGRIDRDDEDKSWSIIPAARKPVLRDVDNLDFGFVP